MGGVEKILEFVDDYPRGVALSLLTVIVAGGTAGALYISALGARNDAAEAQQQAARKQYEQEVSTLKRARVQLAATLETFKGGAQELFKTVDAQSKAGVPKSCATQMSGVQTGCDALRRALREAEVLAPVFEDLDRLIKISKQIDEPSQYLVQALALRRKGESAQALAFLQSSLKARETAAAYSEMAGVYMKLGRFEEAKAAIGEAQKLALNPEMKKD